ncbi:TPA: TetR/AcrR family transcriptional regulator [Enterococcus faecalis]|uniref:TetR/AcrR family transcriptional regulator n=1 Tax=Enterococcus faecalis TaxID=1351 RepID=UPI001CAE0AFD|nr:TetR/AcrR family transcriptional regulator [Enterococcus faecalis]HBI3768913.1 TetR/AcrR family transcriptional regulator [Enterococcus faecalis]
MYKRNEKKSILKKSIVYLSKYSFEKAKIVDICKSCSISTTTFYYLFPNKEIWFRETIQYTLLILSDQLYKLSEKATSFQNYWEIIELEINSNDSNLKKEYLEFYLYIVLGKLDHQWLIDDIIVFESKRYKIYKKWFPNLSVKEKYKLLLLDTLLVFHVLFSFNSFYLEKKKLYSINQNSNQYLNSLIKIIDL